MAGQPRISVSLVLIVLVAGCTGPIGLQPTPSTATVAPTPGSSPASPDPSFASGIPPTPGPSQPAASIPADLVTHASTKRDGVEVSIDVDSVPLRMDARAAVTLTVENQGQRPVRWLTDGCVIPVEAYLRFIGEDWIGGTVQTGLAAEFKGLALQPLFQSGSSPLAADFEDAMRPGPDQGCLDMGIVKVLEPGVRLERTVFWPDPERTFPAPNGPIEIVASFRFYGWDGDPEDTRYDPIETRLTSWLVSSDVFDFLPPGPAIDAALADPIFAAWLESTPRETWGNSQRDLDRSAGTWDIGLFAGGYMLVKLDARTGQVISRRTL